MILLKLPMGADNLTYVVAADKGRQCAVVDPIDAGDIIDAIKQAGLGQVAAIFNTHGHGDHTGGNVDLAKQAGAPIYAHDPDRAGIPGSPKPVKDDEVIDIDGLGIRVMHTPGHTPGGICLFIQPQGEAPWLISGDTVFMSGCGNPRFGGNPETLYETFGSKIYPLSPQTRLCPGHDYSITNLKFALSVEPDNGVAKNKLEQSQQLQSRGDIPESTLGQEREFSPFFRLGSASIRATLAQRFSRSFTDDRAVFLALRELRNQW